MRTSLLSLIAFLSVQTFAQMNAKVDLSLRSKPLSYNGVIAGAYDGLLWGGGDKTTGMYGFYRLGLKVGGSPTAAAFVQVAPIAPVVFEIQKSTTYRFIKTSSTDCDIYECLHRVDRTDYSLKLGGAYQKYLLLSRFTIRDIESETGSKLVYLETEGMHAVAGKYYRYFETAVTAGYKLDEIQTAGLMYMGGEITGSSSRYTAAYGFYSRKLEWATLTAGLGYYDHSTFANVQDKFRGPSGFVILSRTFGETLGLF